MTRCTRGLGALVVLSTLAVPMSSSAQEEAKKPIERLEPYVVGEALPPLEEGQTMVSMTLEDAVSRALEANLNLQSARLNPAIQEYALRAARAAFTPTLSSTFGYNNSVNQSTSQLDGGSRTTTKQHTFNSSLSEQLPWYGARLNANFNNRRTESNNAFSTRNPSYSSSVSLSFTQPLLAGFKMDNQRASLETQEIQTHITDLQVRSQVENVVGQVREAYWGLRAAIEQIEIQQRSLAQARELADQNRVRARLGRGTEYQVVQAEAQVASSEQALLNAQIQWRNQELILKQLLLTGADDTLLTETINPTDQPELADQAVDIQQAIEVALRERTDLQQIKAQQQITDVNLEVSRSNRLPSLNLTASYSLQGVGGNLFERDQLGGDPVLVQRGGYLDGLQSIADFDTPTWGLTLNASYPLGINSDKINLERARLQARQQQLSLKAQELTVVTQVTSAGLSVNNTLLQYQAAQRASDAAQQNVEAELARFEVGAATNYEVVTAQNSLTTSRLSELRALIQHLNAIAQFERIQRVGN